MTILITCTGIEELLIKEIQETSLVKMTEGARESEEMKLANDPKSLNSYVIS
jgi:hypothetical protein